MAAENNYIMRDQAYDRVARIMGPSRRWTPTGFGWATPPSVLSMLAVVLYVTALSSAG